MKLLIPLLLAFSCVPKEDEIMGYVTGSWVCDEFYMVNAGAIVKHCTHLMTGKREEVIYNPTFVIPVKKNEAK